MVPLHVRWTGAARCLALQLLVEIAQRIAANAAELLRVGLEVACTPHTACDAAPTEADLSLDHLGGRVTS